LNAGSTAYEGRARPPYDRSPDLRALRSVMVPAMLFVFRKLFWIAVGVIGALEADRWLNRQKVRLSPHAMTSSFLDTLNERLEQRSGGRG
jgi:hypothetical protein